MKFQGAVRQTSVCRWLIAELGTRDKLKFVGHFSKERRMKRSLGGSIAALFLGAFLAVAVASGPDVKKSDVTFAKDVAPIFNSNCVGCHRPGEIAPMSLLSCKDARPWAKSIK